MGNKIFHKNWPFSLRFREAQPCSDYTLCQPGSPLSPLTGNECLIFLWRRLPPMMGAASPPPSRRLSCCSVFGHSYDPKFSPPILFYMNASSDEGYSLSANSSSSPGNPKQTSLKLYRLKTGQKETGLGEGTLRKILTLISVLVLAQKSSEMLFFCPCP